MKNNTKGFTLIELLAVIVILAIIALIATPIVLNLIEKAKKGAAESSAYAYIKAVEQSALSEMVAPTDTTRTTAPNYAGMTCTIGANGLTLSCAAGEKTETLTVEAKGTLPEANGTIKFDAKSAVASEGTSFTVDGYAITMDANGKVTATK